MRNLVLPSLLAIAASLGLSVSAHAQLIFSTAGSPDYSLYGEFADTGDPSHSEYYNMAGDIFTPTVNAAANTITFNGTYYDSTPQNDAFTISLYSVNGATGMPGTLLTTSTVVDPSRTVDPNNSSYYYYAGALATPLDLTAGTTYYLGISNTTSPGWDNWLVSVNALPGYLTEYSYDQTDGAWVEDPSAQVLFALSAPEPSSWAMLAIALATFAAWRLRRARAVAVAN